MDEPSATALPGPDGAGRRLPLTARAAALAAALTGAALLSVACGAGTPARASGSSDYQQDVAFAHCMRSHGMPDFPDPLPQGGFPRTGADQNSPQFGSAQKACQHLLPPRQPLSTAQQQQMLARGLQFAKCLRSHKVPDFPDPSVPKGGGLLFSSPPDADSNTPQFQAAEKACHAGTPHGG